MPIKRLRCDVAYLLPGKHLYCVLVYIFCALLVAVPKTLTNTVKRHHSSEQVVASAVFHSARSLEIHSYCACTIRKSGAKSGGNKENKGERGEEGMLSLSLPHPLCFRCLIP